MPLSKAFIGVFVEAFILELPIDLDPVGPTSQHHVRFPGRGRQVRINRRSERVYQLGPFGVINPQRRCTVLAEMPLSRALLPLNEGAVDSNMLFAANVERFAVAAEIDGIATTARRFTAD